MLTKKIIQLQMKFFLQKLKEKCYLKLPKSKREKLLYSLKNGYVLKDLESKYRNEIIDKNFGSHAKGILFETINGQFIGEPKDVEINSSLGVSGQYDWSNISFISRYLNNSMNLYILGAHIGCLLVPLSKYVKNIVAFEANPNTFRLLNLNILLNEVRNVSTYNLAVYDSRTSVTFYQNNANTGGSKVKPITDRFIYHYDQPQKILIEAVSLEDFIAEKKLPMPDFMIMDIEGSEYNALKGAGKILEHCKYLYIEFVPHHLFNVANINVETFLSVIAPHFDQMQIVNNGNELFVDEQITVKLKELYARNVAVDLLFF